MTKLGRELLILLEVVLVTTKLVEIMAMEDVEPIQEDAPLLPHFNKGLPNALAFGHNSTFIAVEIGQGTVTWRGEDDPIELIVDYYCDATIVCQGEFSLNKSDKLVSILDYNTGGRSATDKLHRYTASVNLRAHRKYGFAIVVFKLAIRENLLLRDEARGQYIVHLQPPEDRVVTQGCKFKVNAHFDVNLMTLTFDPSDYMPSGLKWSKLVVYKQVRLKPKPTKSFLYVPLIVITQSPFRVIPLNFYYFKEVILELGDGSRLLIKGTTGNGLNIHDSGLYAVRWYTYDQQHMLDEQCEETALVPIPTRPLPEAPIFAYAKRQTPEEWSLDMRQLQTEIRKQEIPQSRILACIWPDVYQEIPTERKFVLVITRRGFYSVGEQLGFLMYGYLHNISYPYLDLFECHTESMSLAGMPYYVPFPTSDRVTMYPPVLVNTKKSRFVGSAYFTCQKIYKADDFKSFSIKDQKTRFGQNEKMRMPIYPCHKYNYNFNISLRGGDKLRPGSLLNVTFWFRSGKSKSVVVPFDPEPGIQVKPDVALYTQPVTVICFKNRVRILAQAGISLNQLEYIQLFGEISYQNYVQIGNYTSRGFQLNTKIIDSSAKLSNSGDSYPNLVLESTAYHLYKFRGFRCRLKVNREEVPEFEESTATPLCYMRLPQPIVLTVDNITAPVNASLKFIQHTNMQIYQASCMQPLSRITFTCSQWREMESCHNLSNVDTFYTVDTDLILFLANTSEYIQRKPVFDRLGRGRVEIASVPLQWNYAEVACHRTVHLLDAKQSILVDQYSSAVRLCVSEMSFRFYVTHVGFDLDKGLTMSLAELKEMGAVTELEMGRINKVEVGSAVLCEVTEGTSVNYTEIKYLNAKDKPIDAYLMFKYASVALIVLLETGRHKNEFIDLYCQSGGENSRIPSKSNVLRLLLHEAVLKNDGSKELFYLFTYILATVGFGMLLAGCCPLIVMARERRMHRQKVKRRRIAEKKLKRIDYLRQIGLERADDLARKLERFDRSSRPKGVGGKKTSVSMPDEISQQQQQTATSVSTLTK